MEAVEAVEAVVAVVVKLATDMLAVFKIKVNYNSFSIGNFATLPKTP